MSEIEALKRPLALKLTATITIIVVLVVAIVTLLTIRRERQTFQAELEQQAALLVNTIAASSADSLYFLDADFLSDLMLDLGRFEVITFGRIYDEDGRIVADAFDQSILFSFDPDPFGLQLLQTGDTLFTWQDEQLIAGQSVIIGSEVVGAVSVGLPTAFLEPKIAAVRNQGIIIATIAVIIGLILALFFSRSITIPLQAMIQATQRIMAGDLTQRVDIHSKDELALLGGHFNQMTAQLQQTLEQMEQEIDERKRAQIALEAARDAAESANRAKSTFLANMSHELRTPLSAIIGYSELMLEQIELDDYEELEDELKRVIHAGEHLLMIISDILDLSKIEAGKMELVPETFDLTDFIESVAMTAQPLAHKKGNKLVISCDEALGEFYADRSRVRQILLNLLGNAAKFTDHGTITLTAAREQAATGSTIRFTVSDTGIGIPNEQMRLLFKPFVQVDPSSTRRYEGTGLGLAISHRFCQMMGGRIMVESEVGKGSTFTVDLPVAVDVMH
ncbi:MAG: HAMP domain-containing protein [Anaerolineales bacterium]|nr:HAMP domain-containing protein [Anaerolineales bacterium]